MWLNSWGCRQFKKADHGSIAGKSLTTWADRWVTRLPEPATYLSDVSEQELRLAADAYEDLRVQLASERHLRSGQMTYVHYGPVGAAKTLFALRPRVFAPWDKAIMLGRGYGWADYGQYLRDLINQLRELSAWSGIAIEDLPGEVGRPGSTPVKIIDEYNWVVLTNQFEPPPVEDLEKWIGWARATSNFTT